MIGKLDDGVFSCRVCWYLYVIEGGGVWMEEVVICINCMAVWLSSRD